MKRHPLDVVSLVFGLAFVAMSLLFSSRWLQSAARLRWAGIGFLFVLGLSLLWSAGRRPEAGDEEDATRFEQT